MEAARRATPADLEALELLCAGLIAELAAQERGGRVFTNREVGGRAMGEWLADESAVVVAGTYDSVVVGFGTGRTEVLRDGAVLGRIDLLYVEPEARGIGVGEAVMGELLAWFRGRGCIGVDAMALPGTRETKNFFEESGFSARLLVVHHRMDREAAGASEVGGDSAGETEVAGGA